MAILVGLTTVGLPVASAGTACSVNDSTEKCSFQCFAGDYISVSASSTSHFFISAKISASCGGVSVTCTASAGETCSAKSTDTATSSDAGGTCEFSGTSGTGSCNASGHSTGGKCINVVVACVECPSQICAITANRDDVAPEPQRAL